MTRFARARGLFRPVVAVFVGAALIFATLRFRGTGAAPAADAGQPPVASTSREGEGVVCFGTVDLEHGVAALTSLQPGRVTEVLVAENQEVGQGTELLRLEDTSARTRLAEAEAGVELARLQLRQSKKQPEFQRIRIAQQQAMRDAMHSRVEAARRVLEREQRLAKSAIITDSDRSINQEKIRELEAMERAELLRQAELETQDADAETRRAEAELKAAEARREQARLALQECRLRAPRPGIVLRILVGPGDVLASQPGVLFAAAGPQVIRATVEQEFSGRVKEGEPALVRDDADPTATWKGRVGRVAGWYSQRRTILHDPSQLSDMRTLECLIVLEPGQPRLRLGQSVRIFIGPASP
jgi:multidrug resistance efflux pump